MLSCLSAGAVHRAPPSSPLRGYEQFPFFTNSPSFWRRQKSQPQLVGRGCFPSSLPFISLLAQQSILRARSCACFLSASSSAPPPPSGSRGGRPVSAKPIGKQRPKMYFPVSFPSLTSKHSNGSWKNMMRPQFLLTMIYCHLAATSSATKI